MTLKLSMKHHVCEYYQSCSNEVAGLTLTHFTPRSIWSHRLLNGQKVKIIYCLETIAALGLKFA